MAPLAPNKTTKSSMMLGDREAQYVPHPRHDDAPPRPGTIVQREIIDRLKVSQVDLARAAGVSAVRIHHLLNGKYPLTAELALRLSKITSTDPVYWMELQSKFSLYCKSRELKEELDELREFVKLPPRAG